MNELKIFFQFLYSSLAIFDSLLRVEFSYLWGSDLYWDAGLDPLLAQVAVRRDAAVVGWSRQQEDVAQQVVSTRNAAEAEQEHEPLLERTPSSQKTHCLIVVLHCSNFIFTTTVSAWEYFLNAALTILKLVWKR